MRKILHVKGMHCSSCEILLSEASEEAGAKVVSINHKTGELVVEVPHEGVLEKVLHAVKMEGYAVR